MKQEKNRWYIFCLCFLSGLLVNPLFEWAGLPRPLIDGANHSNNLARFFIFFISFSGIHFLLDRFLSLTLGNLYPKIVYKKPPAI